MTRFDVREHLPSRDSLPSGPNGETVSKYKLYSKLALVLLAFVLGPTAVISGGVLLPVMAMSVDVLGVVLCATSISVGLIAIGGAYLWLTSPV